MAEQGMTAHGSPVLSRIAELLDVRDGALSVMVDGAAITIEAKGRAARLACVLADALPGDEAVLRHLMHQYLAYADDGGEVLCADPAGRLVLVAEVLPGDDVPGRTAEFCDAAVHWRRVVQDGEAEPLGRGFADARGGSAQRLPPTMIFP